MPTNPSVGTAQCHIFSDADLVNEYGGLKCGGIRAMFSLDRGDIFR